MNRHMSLRMLGLLGLGMVGSLLAGCVAYVDPFPRVYVPGPRVIVAPPRPFVVAPRPWGGHGWHNHGWRGRAHH